VYAAQGMMLLLELDKLLLLPVFHPPPPSWMLDTRWDTIITIVLQLAIKEATFEVLYSAMMGTKT